MPRFHKLRVAAVDRLTEDAVALSLEVPTALRKDFAHAPGQHLTVRRMVDGEDVRRTYSICSPAPGSEGPSTLRVGVRRVRGGSFSTYACEELRAGDELEVMPPAGRFILRPAPGRYAAIVGGSGITPVLSLAATLLAAEEKAQFLLVRSDRSVASTMFLDEVAELKDRYPHRFQLVTSLTQEAQQAGLASGRLDADRLRALLPALLPTESIQGWFLCGPQGLVEASRSALLSLEVPADRVHQEVFHLPGTDTALASSASPSDPGLPQVEGKITALLDGRSGSWTALPDESVLDTVLRNRAEAPYACKGGVCGTCRAFLVSGEVRMEQNYALEPEETDAGYVLACQSHPRTAEVEVDFDR